jgi:hypothetical protein
MKTRTAHPLSASGCAVIALLFVVGAPRAQHAVSANGNAKSGIPAAAQTAPRQGEADAAARSAALRGIWESDAWSGVEESGRPVGGIAAVNAKTRLSMHPPYNEEWEAKYQAAAKDKAKLAAIGTTMKVCSFAFPAAMESPSLFQILVTAEETLFVFATPEVRHIYTDGRGHPGPDDLWSTPMGDSIGHWEGTTLVVETIARRADKPLRISSPMTLLSDQARFTERFRRVSDTELEDEMTVEDPVALARPWVMTLKFRKVTDLDRLPPHDCSENDRNPVVDGKLTITPP